MTSRVFYDLIYDRKGIQLSKAHSWMLAIYLLIQHVTRMPRHRLETVKSINIIEIYMYANCTLF